MRLQPVISHNNRKQIGNFHNVSHFTDDVDGAHQQLVKVPVFNKIRMPDGVFENRPDFPTHLDVFQSQVRAQMLQSHAGQIVKLFLFLPSINRYGDLKAILKY